MQSLGESGIIGHKNEVEVPAEQNLRIARNFDVGGAKHNAGGANCASASRACRSIALAPVIKGA